VKTRNNKIDKIIILVTILFIVTSILGLRFFSKTSELTQLKNNGHTQMMGYIIKTDNDKIIVVDGGTEDDTQNLIDKINEYTGKVDYWFITHPHRDHATCFINIVENTDIEIGQIYVSVNEKEWYEQYGDGREDEVIRFIDTLDNPKLDGKVNEVSLNQIIQIDNIKCEILGIKNPEITINAINNSSMVIKMTTNKNTILFLGDTGTESANKLLENQKDKLKADIIQMAHHGQNGASKELYEEINPTICMWPTPDWLWINDSGDGEDSGPWKTKETREWVQSLQIKQNIIEKDGDIKIEI
jgi:hypothetical protein